MKSVSFLRCISLLCVACLAVPHCFTLSHDKWAPVTTAWRVLGLRMKERSPVWEGSCEYIEQAVADSRQEVVIQVGGWARC